MIADLLSQHRTEAVALLAALSVFAIAIAASWTWITPDHLKNRLKDQASGEARERVRRTRQRAEAQTVVGLREQQSHLLARLVSVFRIGDRLNDGKLTNKLQQAGYRGRGATLQYLSARIVSPLALTAGAGLFVILIMPEEPLHIRAGILFGGAVAGFFLPPIMLKNRIDKRKIEIGRVWPDAVDLLLICVETGMSIEHAFRKVAEEMASSSIELAKEMSLTNAELNYLKERRQAYENLSRRIDIDAVKAVTGTLIQSERYGTPLGSSLRVLAQESRSMRMAAAEKKAAALPPKLTVPMIVFFLPVLFAVIITPAALQAFGN